MNMKSRVGCVKLARPADVDSACPCGCYGGGGDGDGDGDGDDDRCCASVYSPWRLELTPQAVCSIFMTLTSLCCAGVSYIFREHMRT